MRPPLALTLKSVLAFGCFSLLLGPQNLAHPVACPFTLSRACGKCSAKQQVRIALAISAQLRQCRHLSSAQLLLFPARSVDSSVCQYAAAMQIASHNFLAWLLDGLMCYNGTISGAMSVCYHLATRFIMFTI